MLFRIGTSGFSFPKWRGRFYPQPLPPKDWLSFYARHLPTVEVNNSFHRMPSRSVLERWGRSVTAGFVFALKVPQRITQWIRAQAWREAFIYFKHEEDAPALAQRMLALAG